MHAVIKATFADWRTVKGRAVLQLICEVPVEDTKRVLDTLGAPVPGSDIWVAVARLVEPKENNGGEDGPAAADIHPTDSDAAPAAAAPTKRRWSELSRAQRAGMLCEDEQFWTWLETQDGVTMDVINHEEAAHWVRKLCQVESRAYLDGRMAAPRWDALEARFMQATGRMAVDR